MLRAVLKAVPAAMFRPAPSGPTPVPARAEPRESRAGRIVPIQGLRAVAALGVAFAHFHNAFLQVGSDNTMGVFGFGVDLFFVISGFIMLHVSRDAFGSAAAGARFLYRRLIRIVPLYWLCSLAFLHYILSTQPIGPANLSWPQIGASFAFIPWPRPAGGTNPLLDVGWTLNYEMFFYVCFAAALMLPRRWALTALVAGMVAFVYAGKVWVLPVPLSVWASKMVYEFLFGVALAAALPFLPRVNGAVASALIIAGVAVAAGAYFGGRFTGSNRHYVWGSAAVLMVSGATLYRGELTGWVAKVMCVLGDSSYAIYLIHPLVLYHTLNTTGQMRMHGLDLPVRTWPAVSLMLAFSTLLAITAHYMFERPVGRWLARPLASSPTA